jgi:hypothetical protein
MTPSACLLRVPLLLAHSACFAFLSYTYDLTSTLQSNATSRNQSKPRSWPFTSRFAWNYHLFSAAFENPESDAPKAHWVLPLIHGHVDQASSVMISCLKFLSLTTMVH